MVLLKTFNNLKTYIHENKEMNEYDREHGITPAIRKDAIRRWTEVHKRKQELGYDQVPYSLASIKFIQIAIKCKMRRIAHFINYNIRMNYDAKSEQSKFRY